MKKPVIFGMALVLCMGILTGCGSSTKLSEHFDEETVIAEAERIVELANAEKYDEIINQNLDEDYREQFTTSMLRDAVSPLLDERGAFREFGKEVVLGQNDETNDLSYAVAVIQAKYVDGNIQFTITFDEDMTLAGLYVE